jgi:lysophospholipid acyltransferase (LPLAT)-like uncharacterized protein
LAGVLVKSLGTRQPIDREVGMKLSKNPIVTKLGGLSAAMAVRTWMSSIDFQSVLYDPTIDPVREDCVGPVICIFWHEYLLAPFYLRGRTDSAILTSRHRDAEWLSEAARHLGFRTVRGSTNRGGGQAMLELMRRHGTRNLGIACDGPRGPRRRLAPGPIYLSSRLQLPIVTFTAGYDRVWRMPTWDRFALPQPGCRGRVIIGPRMSIPPNLPRQGIEHYRRRVEAVLLRLTWEAEAWAAAGTRKVGQVPARCQPPCRAVPRHRLPSDDRAASSATPPSTRSAA